MKNSISNKTNSIGYFEPPDFRLLDSNSAIKPRVIQSSDLLAHMHNGMSMQRNAGAYKLISGLGAIPSRTNWVFNGFNYSYLDTASIKKSFRDGSVQNLYRLVKKYKNHLKDKNLGVELSGGLDTSLIIEVLERLDIKYSLIAFVSDKYEFRTERKIQEIYAANAPTIKIPYATCIPFWGLKNTPIHAYPDVASLFYHRQSLAVNAAKKLGIDILLNGDAGDNLLGQSIPAGVGIEKPQGFERWMITDDWSDMYVYKPQGLTYLSAFALPTITRLLLKMRSGQAEDSKKMWARAYFKDILPRELSKYAYKASHDGWFANGLQMVAPDIFDICEIAYSAVNSDLINPDLMVESAMKYRFLSNTNQTEFLSKLSFANWVFAYNREGMLRN